MFDGLQLFVILHYAVFLIRKAYKMADHGLNNVRGLEIIEMKNRMKKVISLIPVLFFWYASCFADEIPASIFTRYKLIVNIVSSEEHTS